MNLITQIIMLNHTLSMLNQVNYHADDDEDGEEGAGQLGEYEEEEEDEEGSEGGEVGLSYLMKEDIQVT